MPSQPLELARHRLLVDLQQPGGSSEAHPAAQQAHDGGVQVGLFLAIAVAKRAVGKRPAARLAPEARNGPAQRGGEIPPVPTGKTPNRGPVQWLSLIHISEPTRLLSISYAV